MVGRCRLGTCFEIIPDFPLRRLTASHRRAHFAPFGLNDPWIANKNAHACNSRLNEELNRGIS